MFKRLMASLGVGSSKVNLVLDKEQYHIGEPLKGRIIVEGGNVDQEINTLDVDLVMKFNIRGKQFSKTVETIKVARNFYVKAKETREVPFEHYLPFHYPVSKGSVAYYLLTRMDIARAVDTGDTDAFTVMPGKDMALIMDALSALGFREKIGSGKIEKYGQEFDYYPTGLFEDKLKGLGVKFFREEQNIKMFLELGVAGGHMIPAKHHTELAIPPGILAGESVEKVAGYIREFIENELKLVAAQGPNNIPAYHNYQGHQHGHGRPGFGGFMGGMVAGLLGAAVLGSLFDGAENEGAEGADAAGGEEGDGGGFDLGFDDFGGDDLF
ncbi:sporulation-control protein [Desulfocucumis palustris]|uniref:Sporulation-control protein n=1 Tax=Desulfocucumis palustris TaxID=1898651 RepID=A0A2L2XCR2_9FIRM|nr:sporulation protein [Desulfocucumis palustris]GBF33503.1 sporulation-control protein [Desulfocucumis palustris]